MTVERKAVRRNLMELIDFGYNIEYSESVRVNKNGSEDTVYTDWYLEKDFSDATEFWFKKVVEDQDKYYKNL
ncbi:MAG: hypothetical protein PHG07_10785, partial [Lachnospiraceae bacterium]|nr:hypothetical protein [Lachnospiraceae bacterium]